MLLRHTHTFKEPENKLGGRSIKHVNDKVLYDVNICSHSISAVQTACLTRFPQDHLLRWPSHFQGLTLVPPPKHELICKLYLSRTGTGTRWEYSPAGLVFFSSPEDHILRHGLV